MWRIWRAVYSLHRIILYLSLGCSLGGGEVDGDEVLHVLQQALHRRDLSEQTRNQETED